MAEGQERDKRPRAGWENLSDFFCYEMVHFGAKITNAVHHHWFSAVKMKRLT